MPMQMMLTVRITFASLAPVIVFPSQMDVVTTSTPTCTADRFAK